MTNAGPSTASGAIVTFAVPATVTAVVRTCVPAGGASCPAGGSGPVSATVSLPVGGSLALDVDGTASGLGAARHVTTTTTVAGPAGLDDPDPADNAASLALPVRRSMGFHTLTPCLLLDTRGPAGARGGPALAASTSRTFPIAGACGIPATAWAVSLNVTVTQVTGAGHVRLYPGGTPLLTSSVVNFTAGATRANNAVAPLGNAGDLTVFDGQASGTVHLILDVNGYFE